jgi:high-affinity Fe2+/Pb2+ permease
MNDDIIARIQTIKDNLNKQKEDIERLVQKAKETGEELPPEIIAEFEKEKQNVAGINKSIDDTESRLKKTSLAPRGIERLLVNLLYICAYLGGVILSLGLMSVGYQKTKELIWLGIAGTVLLVVISIIFIIWIIRGIIRRIARIAKNA